MRLSPVLTLGAALIAALVIGVLGIKLLQPNRPLLSDVSFNLPRIRPNVDGVGNITLLRYTLNRNADITVSFKNKATADVFYFRNKERRAADNYQVNFSGIVDGYVQSGEQDKLGGTVETRLLPDGSYTWTVAAVTDGGETAQANGDLEVAQGDKVLPAITNFEITPGIFTPNQDGYDDRVSINVSLAKQAQLTVYLEGNGLGPIYIAERQEGSQQNSLGGSSHFFDYDGGVDNELQPPPDGDYQIVVLAQDTVGQRIRRTSPITIKDGGLPNAEIIAQSTGGTVTWGTAPYNDSYLTDISHVGKQIDLPPGVTSTQTTITLPQSDLLLFRLTVSNYGVTPLRTIGPWPGTVYQYDQTDAAMGTTEALSGAWRVGIQCERSESSYPWRWAIGAQADLLKVDHDGETLWYLPPGKQTVVWGAIRMTKLIKTRNPQQCYAALIHEDVIIPPLQNGLGAISMKLTTPNEPQ